MYVNFYQFSIFITHNILYYKQDTSTKILYSLIYIIIALIIHFISYLLSVYYVRHVTKRCINYLLLIKTLCIRYYHYHILKMKTRAQ